MRLLLLVTLVQGFSAFYPLNCCLPVEEPYLGSRSDTPVRGAEKGEQQLSAFFIVSSSDHRLALSLLVLNFAHIVGFVKVDTLISLSCYTNLSKLIHGFVKVAL